MKQKKAPATTPEQGAMTMETFDSRCLKLDALPPRFSTRDWRAYASKVIPGLPKAEAWLLLLYLVEKQKIKRCGFGRWSVQDGDII